MEYVGCSGIRIASRWRQCRRALQASRGVALPRRETTKVDIVAQGSGARSLRAHRHHQLPAALSSGVALLRRSIRVISHTVESVVMASNPAQMVLLDMVTPTLRA